MHVRCKRSPGSELSLGPPPARRRRRTSSSVAPLLQTHFFVLKRCSASLLSAFIRGPLQRGSAAAGRAPRRPGAFPPPRARPARGRAGPPHTRKRRARKALSPPPPLRRAQRGGQACRGAADGRLSQARAGHDARPPIQRRGACSPPQKPSCACARVLGRAGKRPAAGAAAAPAGFRWPRGAASLAAPLLAGAGGRTRRLRPYCSPPTSSPPLCLPTGHAARVDRPGPRSRGAELVERPGAGHTRNLPYPSRPAPPRAPCGAAAAGDAPAQPAFGSEVRGKEMGKHVLLSPRPARPRPVPRAPSAARQRRWEPPPTHRTQRLGHRRWRDQHYAARRDKHRRVFSLPPLRPSFGLPPRDVRPGLLGGGQGGNEGESEAAFPGGAGGGPWSRRLSE